MLRKTLSFVLFILIFIPYFNLCTVSANNDIDVPVDKIDDYVQQFIGKSIAGAQISITKGNKIIFSKGYGLSNVEKNIPVTQSSTFNFASISKLFIWVSAMQLKEQGKLDLNEDIKKYLPADYPLHLSFSEPVTFLNLMNHNAGFEAYWKYYSGSGESRDFSSLGESIYSCYSGVQCFKPGEIEGYSNYGANLAAYIVETISGIPFYEYVNENIFKVCGMNCCYPERNPVDSILANKATGYTNKSYGKFIATACYSGDWLYASGSVIGCADDLSLFANALMPKDGEISPLFDSNDTLKELLSISYSPTGEELFSIHHGLWGTDGNFKGLSHTGCVDGMVSNFVIVPEKNLSISILVNDQDGVDISYGVVWLLTGNDYAEIEDKSDFPDSKLLDGKYVHVRTRFFNRKTPFLPYEVQSIDKNKIQVTINGSSSYYKQIRPYIYENITDTRGINFKSKIYFKVQDRKVVKATIWKNDLVPIESLAHFINKE